MKRHVAELIEKIEKLCNEGHQTEAASASIPPTQEQEGPSSHTTTQRRTRRPFSVGEVEALVRSVELLGVGMYDVINNISISLPLCVLMTF